MRFKTKELIFIALMAALLFVINLVIGSGLIVITGVPGASGFITGVTNLIFITLVALVLKRLGAVTLLYLIYGLLALPTHMAGGPPGFIWKIPPLVITAFLLELTVHIANYRRIGFIIALPIFAVVGVLVYIITYWLVGMPELEKILAVWPFLTVVFIVLGYIGIWLGFVIYNRLKNKRIIRQITA